MSTIIKISDELDELDKLIDKARSEGEIPQYGQYSHNVIKETIGIRKTEINGVKTTHLKYSDRPEYKE